METLNKKKIERILIFQTAFLGDVLLTLPWVYFLKEKMQNVKIDLCAREEFFPLKELLPNHINNFIPFNKKNNKFSNSINLIKLLRKEKYDLIFSPHRSFRTSLILCLSGAEHTYGFDTATGAFLYDNKKNYLKGVHEIERNLKLTEDYLSVSRWNVKIPVNISHYEKSNVFNNWIKNNKKIIGIAPGSVWETKKYPEDYFSELINILVSNSFKVVLLGGPEEVAMAKRILSGVQSKGEVLSFAGNLSLLESISIIDRCNLLICNDSAPTHMGVLTNTRVLTIYGSTIPEFGFFPYRNEDAVINISDLECKPCGIHGRKKCPEGHFRCMRDLFPAMIAEKALSMI